MRCNIEGYPHFYPLERWAGLILTAWPNAGHAGDGVQRPLRFHFPPRLMPSVRLRLQTKGVSTEFGASRDP
jgi:hypothetical protein